MLTALVVDRDALARRRVAGLLRLGGWQVREASDAEAAHRVTASSDVDLVVTDVAGSAGTGPAMLRRMRRDGSRARFLVITADPTDEARAEAITAGAMACLAKPVAAHVLLDFLRSRTTGPAAQGDLPEPHGPAGRHDDDVDAALMDRLHGMYLAALPARLGAITAGTRSGNAPAVASAAHTLAGTSGQFGHADVASICQAIAADARRGVMAHARVEELQALAQVS
ncbi:response regulator [Blastococcus tunisiensis]|uniref:Hpt domain-containing protein n=1 Tax=Blastococcus tunisiensis TaxID=1798228 RepID=A0A1I2LLI1_9ACTN|nr:response regulator [Blastococcus sp. DSM 46838]SFF79269.1 Hpt domain-containing protein [Blastococcus sp. DSM 46838]